MHFICAVNHTYTFPAVRKNRYIVLPVDFEEAWKVRYLSEFGPARLGYINSTASFSLPSCPQQTVKRSDETHEFCTCHLFLGVDLYFDRISLYRSVIWFRLVSTFSYHVTSQSPDPYFQVPVVHYRIVYYTFLCRLHCHLRASGRLHTLLSL